MPAKALYILTLFLVACHMVGASVGYCLPCFFFHSSHSALYLLAGSQTNLFLEISLNIALTISILTYARATRLNNYKEQRDLKSETCISSGHVSVGVAEALSSGRNIYDGRRMVIDGYGMVHPIRKPFVKK